MAAEVAVQKSGKDNNFWFQMPSKTVRDGKIRSIIAKFVLRQTDIGLKIIE